MDLSTLFAGPLGGLLGLGGAIFQKWMGMKEAKQNHEFKMAEMEMSAKVDVQKADIAFRQTVEEANAASFTEAIKAQGALNPTGITANIMTLFRPGLTLALWITATSMSIAYRNEDPAMMEFIITSTFSMFSMATGYWFGVRTDEKFRARNR
jgi:hypothetical protein